MSTFAIEHTPGPWKVESFPEVGKKGSVYVSGAEGWEVSPVCSTWETESRIKNEANAQLIAAAPDLLAACRECLSAVDEAYSATGHFRVAATSEQRMRLEAAITKATGNLC